MSSVKNASIEELERATKERAKEIQRSANMARNQTEKIKKLDILLNSYDPNNRLNRDKFKSLFYNFERKLSNKSSLQNRVDQFINSLSLDEFDGLLRDRLDKETKEILNQMLGKSSYSGRSFYIQNKKKNNGKLKRFIIYLDYLQGTLRLPSAEEKRIRDKIKKLQRKVDEDYSKLGKLDDKKKQILLQNLIELGVLKNLRDEKNNANNPESLRITRVIDDLKSCEKQLLEFILEDLNRKMYAIQQDFSKIKDKVVKKKLIGLDEKVKEIPTQKNKKKKIINSNSIEDIVSSAEFYKLNTEIEKYKKILKKTKEIIEESARKNPFKRIKTLKGSEKKVYKMTFAIEKIIEEIEKVLKRAKGNIKNSSSSMSTRSLSNMSSRLGRLQQRRI